MSEEALAAETPEIPVETSAEVETNNAPEKTDGEEKQESAPAEKPEEKPEPSELDKYKHATQKRIDALTARRSQAERALQAAQEELQRLRPKESDEAPKEDDFENTEDYLKELGKWEARQEFKKEQQEAADKQRKDAYEKQMNARRAVFAEKEAAMREKAPDYDDAISVLHSAIDEVGNNAPGMKAFRNIMLSFEDLPAMSYHLGKNPDVIEKLKGAKSDIDIARILFIEEYKLQNAPKKEETKKPEPPNPLRGAKGSAPSKKEDEMSGKELRKKYGLI